MYFYGYVLGIGTDSLSMWTRSDAGPVVIFFVLFLNVQIAIAFLMAALFTSAKTATVFRRGLSGLARPGPPYHC